MPIAQSIIKVDDEQLISLIRSALRRVAFLGPSLSELVAVAIQEQWQLLGKDNVQVILDIDPEVFRLGYGEFKAVQDLQNFAKSMSANVRQQTGIRIGILVIDGSTLIYAPTPKLIGAGASATFQPNAVFLHNVPESILNEIGWDNAGTGQQIIGIEPVSESATSTVDRELKSNPPMSFDIAQKVRVFNSQFEFVELEVKGCNIQRKTITIPDRLMALVSDKATRERMRTTYKLVSDESGISGDQILWAQGEFVDRWLKTLPGFGQVVLRSDKEKLTEGINSLKQAIEYFQQHIAEKLQKEINLNCERLYIALLPAILQNPPQDWLSQMGQYADEERIKSKLLQEIQKLFGNAGNYLSEMKIKILFKAVTYEMLTDPKFIETARRALPDLLFLHNEFLAAPNKQPNLFHD